MRISTDLCTVTHGGDPNLGRLLSRSSKVRAILVQLCHQALGDTWRHARIHTCVWGNTKLAGDLWHFFSVCIRNTEMPWVRGLVSSTLKRLVSQSWRQGKCQIWAGSSNCSSWLCQLYLRSSSRHSYIEPSEDLQLNCQHKYPVKIITNLLSTDRHYTDTIYNMFPTPLHLALYLEDHNHK